jgi:hypothetical protein
VGEVTLNNNGDVASNISTSSSYSYSMLWKYNEKKIDLNDRFGDMATGWADNFVPEDMNDSLQICGSWEHWVSMDAFFPSGMYHGFLLWQLQTPQYKILTGSLSDSAFGAYINNKGTIAGSCGGSYKNPRAAIWQNDSVFVLNDYMIRDSTNKIYSLAGCKAINDSGAIAGLASVNGIKTAFLLVPEPQKIITPTLGTPGLLSIPTRAASGPVDAYDVRGRMLGTFTLNSRGRLTDKSGRPAYGVHFVKPRGCTTPNVSRKILNIR